MNDEGEEEEMVELRRDLIDETLAEVRMEIETAFRLCLDIQQDRLDYEEGTEAIIPHLRNVLQFLALAFEGTGLVDDWEMDGSDIGEMIPDGGLMDQQSN